VEARYESGPGFFAALGGAFAGYVTGAVLVLLFLFPFALASSSALALGRADAYRGLGTVVLAALILAVAQLVIAAWVTQHVSAILGDGRVRFRRALGAIVLGYLTNLFVGSEVRDVAAVPVVGGAWVGLLIVALVVSSGRADTLASAA